MCGIFGYVDRLAAGDRTPDRVEIERQLAVLFRHSETRGKEAAGLALLNSRQIAVHKDSVSASEMLKTPEYKDFWRRFFDRARNGTGVAALGHARLVTNGVQVVDGNNQPVVHGTTVVVHNGIIVNDSEIWASHPHLSRHADVDTEVVAAILDDKLKTSDDIAEALSYALGQVYGETTIGALFADRNILALTTNTGSLYVCVSPDRRRFFFVSEDYVARRVRDDDGGLEGFRGGEIQQVMPGLVLIVDLETLGTTWCHINSARSALTPSSEIVLQPSYVAPRLGFMREIEEKHARLSALRKAMRHCSKCLLPATMPYIRFDAAGVCNYCNSHRPLQLKGRDALEEELARIRSPQSGKADCLVAFSGGRDSSYGLHLLVKELGMRPVTYTYDWGMVTDLGRRNQARLCAKLGVEHIWVSADIRKKRANIRRNVVAWLRRPELGTIPLFMAGDKQFFYYASQTMRHTGIDNMIFCANVLERTDFKSGFASVEPTILKSDSADGEPFYSLGSAAKLKIAAYYGTQFLANPAYWNRSVPDTLFAYASYYLFKQPFINIFDYLPWREETVNFLLLSEYDWETAKDTRSTWRIGDGTAPFYNYIYHEVAGFTEFDTFRSNQIREGHLTRTEAAQLVDEDNQPRWESIRDYCLLINVDFEECLRRINRIPKLYLDVRYHI